MIFIEIFIPTIALVFIFLFSLQKLSHQIEVVAGEKFKTLMNSWTKTPLRSFFTGGITTAVIQSSAATSVILISLVNSKIITFTQSLGAIIGANIGTTITAQLVALKMTYVAPFVVIAGFIISHSHSRLRKYGKSLFYFGMIFFTLYIISILIEPIKNSIIFTSILASTRDWWSAILIGAILTIILQSSSLITGLVIVMASQGFLDIYQSVGIILGSNIGSPFTALIASFSATTEAKKVAFAHFLFNFIGAIIFFPFLNYFIFLIQKISNDPVQQIVNAHFLFNAIVASICLIFIKKFEKFVTLFSNKITK